MDALFSKTIKTNERTYLINVKEAKNKAKYLTISESKMTEDEEERFSQASILLFSGQAENFRAALEGALKLLKE